MPLRYQPKPRSVVSCDFAGFRVPEMTKRRPAVVLRAHKQNRKLVYVVPLSTTPPDPVRPYHFRFERSPVGSGPPTEAWAKCDMVAVVSIERLSLLRSPQDVQSSGEQVMISESQFAALRHCVAIAFGFGCGSYIWEEDGTKCEENVDAE